MKDFFEELEAEVDQNVVNRKYDKIEQKNLLIANNNLIADCLSKEVFYIAINFELTVSRFTKMHDAHTIIQARCLELEVELSKLNDKIQKDDHNELVKRFQTLRYAIDVEPITPRNRNNREVHLDYLKHLKESVETLREIVEEAKVEKPLDRSLASACLYTKQSHELLEYPTGRIFTLGEQCPLTRLTKSNVLPVQQTKNVSTSKTIITEKLSNTSQKRLTSYQRINKLYKAIPTSIPTLTVNQVIQILLWYLDSGCSKHMTGDHSRLRNFMKKFIRTVRFRNDHFGAIMGKHSCYVRDTDGVELIKGSHGSNLYTISVEDIMMSSPICLLSKASKNKSWLWHRRLNHLNFDTINDLARKDLVRGLPRLKFEKDHLCSAS
ncbi:retrovirus-related pol polyprotein from transposon TNT 1-94 [Tanacetum coccineum]